jgi:hypothetical protein
MTRETKVGLIVAGSFLCLVCIVVASKLRHSEDPTNGNAEESSVSQVAAVKPTQNASVPEAKKKKDEPTKSVAPGVVLPAHREPTDGRNLPPLVILPKDPSSLPMPPKLEPAPAPGFPNSADGTPAPPISNPGILTLPPITPPAQIVQAKDEKDKGILIPPPMVSLPPNQFPPLQEKPSVPNAVKPGTSGPLEMPPPVFGKLDPLPDPAKPIVKPESVLTFPPLAKDPPPAIVPFNEKDPPNPTKPLETVPTFPVNPKDTMPTFPKDPASVTPLNAKDGPPAFPSVPKDAGTLPPLGFPTPLPRDVNAQVPSITIPMDAVKPGIAQVPNDTLKPTGPIPRIPGNDLPSTPPIMAKPGFANDSARRPMPIIRDTDLAVCQPGETNFAILSQRFYGTDKYADALLKYNRDNYQATVNGSVFLANTPALVPGQQVHVAPVNILERDYRPFIRTANVAPVPTIPPAAPPLLSKPTPLSPGIATISNPPSAGQARSYTVQSPNGESILDIAERVMGDRGQWHKIWRVNPSYPPQFRIPAGTKLEIPAS